MMDVRNHMITIPSRIAAHDAKKGRKLINSMRFHHIGTSQWMSMLRTSIKQPLQIRGVYVYRSFNFEQTVDFMWDLLLFLLYLSKQFIGCYCKFIDLQLFLSTLLISSCNCNSCDAGQGWAPERWLTTSARWQHGTDSSMMSLLQL